MTDLQIAKNNLTWHTICLCKNGKCIYSDKRGIAPIMSLIEEGIDLYEYSVADKVVGKAAAMLFVKCGISTVYAQTLSQSGKEVLESYDIVYEFDTLTDKIINREGTDICPMEKTLMNCDDVETAYTLLKNKITQMQNNTID